MAAIITITLNPAIDKSTAITTLVPEKKMRCTPPVFEPGGGGVNVARAIKKLGGDATAIYLAGGYTGKFFTQLLRNEGISPVVVEISRHTRENLVVTDKSTNLQYRFGMPGPVINDDEWKELLRVTEQTGQPEFIVASGSVPEGVPVDIFARIGFIAKKKKAKFIADSSGEPLRHAVQEGVYLIKPNVGELSFLAGKQDLQGEEVYEAARNLVQTCHCKAIVVSMGAAGALLVTKEKRLQVAAPVVKRQSTVGAGDSMVAGMVLSLQKGQPIEQAVQFGVACGTAATMNPGTGLCRQQDVNNIYMAILDGLSKKELI